MENRYKTAVVIFLLFFALAASAKNLEKITLQLQWKNQFEYAGWYVAKEKGYYKELGLDVDFVEFNPNINIIDRVLHNKAMYGTTYANIVSEYLKGKPIVFVANFFKQSPLALVTDPKIKLPSDLRGKKVMGVSDDINSAMVLVMFKKFGLSSKDFIHVAPSFTIKDFAEKKVDAMAIFTTNEIYYLNKAKIPYNLLNPSVFGAEFYDLNLFTSRDEALNHPQRVKNFRDATIKGWQYALTHKNEVVELILKKYNTQHKSKEALLFEAKQIEDVMLPNLYPIGSIDTSRLQLMVDDFKHLGFVDANKTINYREFIFRDNPYNIPLTKEEIAFLQTKDTIKVTNDVTWAPFNYNVDDKAEGFSIDFMNLVAKKIGIEVEYVSGYNWSEFIELIQKGEIDVILDIAKTPQREQFLSFTSPYKKVTDAVVTKKDNSKKYNTLKDFEYHTLAVVKGYVEEDILRKHYPNIKLLLVNNTLEALKAVSFSEAEGTIDALGVLNYTIAKHNLSNLTPAFEVHDKKLSYELHMAVAKKQKILRDILQKGIESITEEERRVLNKRWFGALNTQEIDYVLIGQIVFGFVVLLVLAIIWNIKLKQRVKQEVAKVQEQEGIIFYYNKQESMKNIVNNIAHQWKYPLNELSSLVMFLDSKLFLNQEISKEELKRITKLMKENVQFMSQTVDMFNSFYETNETKEYFLVEDAVDETLQIIHTAIEKNSIAVYKEIEEDLALIGNKNQFKQLVLIFLSNAENIFKSRAIKSPKITIKAYKDAKKIIFEIADNAGGITQDLETIFKPTVSTAQKSSGFGLFIAKQIVQQKFHGDIKAQNTKEGALFILELYHK